MRYRTDGYLPNAVQITLTGVASVSSRSDTTRQEHAKRPRRYNVTPVETCSIIEHVFELVGLLIEYSKGKIAARKVETTVELALACVRGVRSRANRTV